MINKAWLIKSGGLILDQSILTLGKGYGKAVKVPVCSVLLETTKGYILVDTGMHVGGLKSPKKIWGDRAKQLIPDFCEKDDILNRLNEIGISSDDIRIVINTHLHWDHTGGNRYFKDAKFFIQKAEYRYALYPDKSFGASYMKNHYDHKLDYQLIEGDIEVVEGVQILFTPGHTPGHQSVLVKFNSGVYMIISGDAVYTEYNINNMVAPGNAYDFQMSLNSIRKIETIRRLTDAIVLPSHEPGENFFLNSYNTLKELEILDGGK